MVLTTFKLFSLKYNHMLAMKFYLLEKQSSSSLLSTQSVMPSQRKFWGTHCLSLHVNSEGWQPKSKFLLNKMLIKCIIKKSKILWNRIYNFHQNYKDHLKHQSMWSKFRTRILQWLTWNGKMLTINKRRQF